MEEFILPAGIKTRNHYVGPGNQTCTADYLTLYAGLAARNWPLVSHALSSEHGVRGQIQWAFDDDGLCLEGHYQAYTISPLLWCLEALWHRGIDLYDERFFTIVHSRGADAIGQGYKYAIVKFLDEQRFAGKPFVERFREQAGDGFHLGASTLLKWNDRQVSMNWGTHIMRGSHDRCALTIATTTAGAKGKPRRVEIGGGAYNHSSFNQAIVIVDEELQRSEPAEPLSYDVEGPVQHIVARSDKHYPGSVITRAFVLLDKHVLVLDRVASERPRTVDWCLPGAGASLSLETKEGSWTEKPDEPTKRHVFGGSIASHQAAVTGETWRDAGVNLTMLGAPNTRLLAYGGNRKGMLVRREGVQRTDYVACFGSDTKTLARVPVTKAGGAEADALGVKVELKDGTVFHALVSYEPKGTEVVLGELKTSAIFATDYSEPKRE
ncbi:MAG: hypothetical protein M5U26_09600 [Planctomycetota bacterium]|nr:hypothetical protein [Planctomycetota bacterium]